MSKKILSILLTAALLVSAAGCGTKAEEETTTTTTTTVAEESIDTTTEAEVEEAPAANFTCTELTDVILNSGVELPAVGPVEDEAILTDVLSYDLSLFEEYSVIMHMMSAHLIEITVAKPAAGKEDAALEFVNNRMNQLKTEVAFYPEQQETADQTVVGSAGGYVYLICCSDAAKAEEALLAKING